MPERSARIALRPSPANRDAPANPGPAIVLRAPGASATVDLGRGGRVASLVVAGRELLVGPTGPDDRSFGWGCFLMAPWVGRLEAGRLPWRGVVHQLPRNHGRNAIHGLVVDVPWVLGRVGVAEVGLSCQLDPAAWPFGGEVRQRLELDANHLILEAEIVAERAMPAAMGWHPWFRRGDTDPRVRVQADHVLGLRRMIPTGELLPVAGRTDLRRGPRLDSRRLDDAYVGVVSPVTITWPDLEVRVEFDAPASVVTVFTPRDAFCVEPQTAWPNAFGMAPELAHRAGAIELGAGASLRAEMRIAW